MDSVNETLYLHSLHSLKGIRTVLKRYAQIFFLFCNLEKVFGFNVQTAVHPNIFLERNSYSFEIFRPILFCFVT